MPRNFGILGPAAEIQNPGWCLLTAGQINIYKCVASFAKENHHVGIRQSIYNMFVTAQRLQPHRGAAVIDGYEGMVGVALKAKRKDIVLSTKTGAGTKEEALKHLDTSLTAITVPFSDADQKILFAQLEYIRPLYCRTCGNCAGKCPRGLPVADILRYLSYSEGYGEFQLGRESFLALPSEVRGVRCKDCGTCAIRCPNGAIVAGRLQIAQELFA